MSDEFNKKSQMGWKAYSAVSGCTGSIIMGVLSLAMYMKPDASHLWLAGAIFGALGAVGSAYSLVAILREDMKDNKQQSQKPKDPPAPH
ncbi:MAG: hypothetical protein KJ667_08065 [Alphaproteobacteria bacterium]|nr:hypothetical protein [Alphaproteobacteria bacterium]